MNKIYNFVLLQLRKQKAFKANFLLGRKGERVFVTAMISDNDVKVVNPCKNRHLQVFYELRVLGLEPKTYALKVRCSTC